MWMEAQQSSWNINTGGENGAAVIILTTYFSSYPGNKIESQMFSISSKQEGSVIHVCVLWLDGELRQRKCHQLSELL